MKRLHTPRAGASASSLQQEANLNQKNAGSVPQPVAPNEPTCGQAHPKEDVPEKQEAHVAHEDVPPITQPSPASGQKLTAFDLGQFRVAQESLGDGLVKKVITTVRVMKPPKDDFIRTHPSDDYQIRIGIIERSGTGETYLVTGSMIQQLEGSEATFSIRRLVTSITKNGDVFLWPLKEGDNTWNNSAREAASIATKKWVRVTSNRKAGYYDTLEAKNIRYAPEWPDEPFEVLMEIAFRGKIINSWDHPVLQELRGE